MPAMPNNGGGKINSEGVAGMGGVVEEQPMPGRGQECDKELLNLSLRICNHTYSYFFQTIVTT
jgi:hypothetical protein